MIDALPEGLGPEPFRFSPGAGPSTQGPAFSVPFKLLVTLVVFGCAGWMVQLWATGRIPANTTVFAWFGAALVMLLWTWWCVLRSVTRITPTHLRQSWVWEKKMELRELAYAKLIRVRGLEWLIAPRLYARTLLGKFAVFYAADPAMVEDFERLVRELKAFRNF